MRMRLASNLEIPIEAVTRTFAVLGIRGSGKTNTAVVLSEELLKAQQQIIVLDPVDVWWGLRSSADGKESGFPVTILGGEHADLPLEPGAGSLIADFAVEQSASLVLSVRHLSIKDQRHFATDLAERLYARKGQQEFRQPLHLIIDECDEFIPQRIPPGGERMFGAFDRIVRRGRASGIGVTMISQRAQVVNKDVLSQIETLVCHRVLHKLDRKALEAWIEAHDVHGRRDEFLGSLASLGRGDAWVWSPEWLDLFERVHFRARETFDSSATPKAGARPVAPKRMAPVDLAQLRERMTAILERAKTEDPRELRKRIAELEFQLKKKTPAAMDPEMLARARQEGERAAEKRLQPEIEHCKKAIADALRALQSVNGHRAAVQAKSIPEPQRVTPPPDRLRHVEHKWHDSGTDVKMSSSERRILTVLAQYPQGRTDSQVAILAGYAVGSGNFNNLLSSLRSKGWAEGPRSALKITEAGFDAMGPGFEPLPTGRDLLEYWFRKLAKAERAILDQLAAAYPERLSDEQVAERTGYVAGSGNFNNAISRLRTLELLEGSRRELKASDALF